MSDVDQRIRPRTFGSAVSSVASRMVAIGVLFSAGCASPPSEEGVSVDQAWSSRSKEPLDDAKSSPASPVRSGSRADEDEPIAIVNGQPIARRRVIDLLLRGHGTGVLEQLIVLVEAERLAAERGIEVTDEDVRAEYDRALQNVLGEVSAGDPKQLRREAAEAILTEMLSARNISHAEFDIVNRRNAIFRKILGADLSFTESQLREEHSRMYGEQVQIRHIQLASRADVDVVLQQRAAGMSFGDLAARYSVNSASASQRGLLPPFAANDLAVPELLRKTAFSLMVGEESEPLFVDNVYQIIRVEKRIPARSEPFEKTRDEVERSLRERMTGPKMRDLYEKLFREAKLEILDPRLKKVFFEKHPDHESAPHGS